MIRIRNFLWRNRIPIRLEVKSWIRIRTKTTADPQLWYRYGTQYWTVDARNTPRRRSGSAWRRYAWRPLTNRSGSRSWRPKNMRILRIPGQQRWKLGCAIYLLLSSDLVRSPAAERVCLEAIRMGTLRRGPPSSSGSSLVYVFTTASGFLT